MAEDSYLCRPTTGDRRVPPSELREYRNSNRFLGPCCLCPLFAVDGAFTEAAMFIETSGPFSGEYVAKCAKGECGFTGQSSYPLWLEEDAYSYLFVC